MRGPMLVPIHPYHYSVKHANGWHIQAPEPQSFANTLSGHPAFIVQINLLATLCLAQDSTGQGTGRRFCDCPFLPSLCREAPTPKHDGVHVAATAPRPTSRGASAGPCCACYRACAPPIVVLAAESTHTCVLVSGGPLGHPYVQSCTGQVSQRSGERSSAHMPPSTQTSEETINSAKSHVQHSTQYHHEAPCSTTTPS